MKKNVAAILLIFILVGLVSAQTSSELSLLSQKFRNFEYDGVIELANEYLTRTDQFSTEQLVNIYEMKAMAHYSKSELDAARFAFESILKLDISYSPDPVKTSPKIIDFFDSIKKDFRQPSVTPIEQPTDDPVEQDTLTVVEDRLGLYQKSIPASFVLPGTGHLIMRDRKRGALLTGAGLLTLASALYFTDHMRSTEQEYLSAIDSDHIESAYKSYNNAYKARNALWIAYAAVWVYAQTDLLFFHEKRQQFNVVAHPTVSRDRALLALTFSF